jgi:amidophosphoribosyltransferase
LTNTRDLEKQLFSIDKRHTNSSSDTEMLLNVFATELQEQIHNQELEPDLIFDAVKSLHKRIQGSYASIALISGHGLLAFRDPFGIRPLIIGKRFSSITKKEEWMVASESLVLENNDYQVVRDVDPGEAIFINLNGEFFSKQCSENAMLCPCAFEYVYLARPDSIMNGISVYKARLKMGDYLSETIKETISAGDVDVVMPIPDSSRPAAMQVARQLGIEYREGFFKNRYVGRTFIMPGQQKRKKSVRQKLNAMSAEFKNKNVLIVDDSIVRGTTSKEIVQMAKDAGANKVFFTSAAPPVRFPHVYGINMPNRDELIAHDRTISEIADQLEIDNLVYQSVENLRKSILNDSHIKNLEMSCFTGSYITGTVNQEYLDWVENEYKS